MLGILSQRNLEGTKKLKQLLRFKTNVIDMGNENKHNVKFVKCR